MRSVSPEPPLTKQERNVLNLLAHGHGVDVIADQLSISKNTVRNHIQNILRKLNVHSRLEAVALAYARYWVVPAGK
jgi:DNA-binding NarL/FixJ family response regulator